MMESLRLLDLKEQCGMAGGYDKVVSDVLLVRRSQEDCLGVNLKKSSDQFVIVNCGTVLSL